MRNSVKPLSRDKYKSKIVDKLIAKTDLDTRWIEVQMLAADRFDVVNCKLVHTFIGGQGLEVSRWWYSTQHGYWKTLDSAIKFARSFGFSFHVVDMR